jgi:hypothetical protein
LGSFRSTIELHPQGRGIITADSLLARFRLKVAAAALTGR